MNFHYTPVMDGITGICSMREPMSCTPFELLIPGGIGAVFLGLAIGVMIAVAMAGVAAVVEAYCGWDSCECDNHQPGCRLHRDEEGIDADG